MTNFPQKIKFLIEETLLIKNTYQFQVTYFHTYCRLETDALLLFSAVAVNCTNSLFKRAIFTWKMAFRFINWAAEHSICSVGRAKKEGRKRRRPLPTTLSSAPYGFTIESIKFWWCSRVSVYHWSHKCKRIKNVWCWKKINLKETSISKLHAFHNFTWQKLPQVPFRIEFINLVH